MFWDILEWHLSLKDTDDDQSNFAAKIKNLDRGKKQLKNSFLSNLGLLFSAKERVLNNFKTKLFPKKNQIQPAPESTPGTTKATKVKTKRKIYLLKLREEF